MTRQNDVMELEEALARLLAQVRRLRAAIRRGHAAWPRPQSLPLHRRQDQPLEVAVV